MRHMRGDPAEGPGETSGPWTETTCVRDRMSRPAVTVAAAAPITEALQLMVARRIHYLPVVDGTTLVGIVDTDDVLGTRRSGPPRGADVAAVMSAPVVSIGPGASLDEAMRLMADRRIGALPVVEDGRLVGILTQSDVVASVARHGSR
ncbi:MAG TPA: CBS domain-containing protein [Methylomirabilota bacterium]|nr:CBS domain-containing protein [Methylomirabilota bacterium]